MNTLDGYVNPGTSLVVAFLIAVAATTAGCDSPNTSAATDVPDFDVMSEIAAGLTVNVVYGGTEQAVDLSKYATIRIGGLAFVALSDVVTTAFPDIDLTLVTVDFLASDGFKPGSSVNCAALIPLAGILLDNGFISPETRNLAWNESLQYPGCMRVGDTAEIDIAAR